MKSSRQNSRQNFGCLLSCLWRGGHGRPQRRTGLDTWQLMVDRSMRRYFCFSGNWGLKYYWPAAKKMCCRWHRLLAEQVAAAAHCQYPLSPYERPLLIDLDITRRLIFGLKAVVASSSLSRISSVSSLSAGLLLITRMQKLPSSSISMP